VQGKEGYYKTKVCKGGFDSGKLRGSFFLSGEAKRCHPLREAMKNLYPF